MRSRSSNRVRQTRDEQVRELPAAEASAMVEGGPTAAQIRQRAHEIYLGRNGAPGNAVLDWLQAETELRARQAAAAGSNGGFRTTG